MCATVPTVKRWSPPPTSNPRSMSTTPKRPSPRRHVSASWRYRSSKRWSGRAAWGNSTVPRGNIGIGLAIRRVHSAPASSQAHPNDRCRSVRARPQARGRGGRLLAALAGQELREHVELAGGFRELPEPTEESGEVTALAQRDARH